MTASVRPSLIVAVPTPIPALGDEASLKLGYLKCLQNVSSEINALTHIVKELFERGVNWKELLDWATEAGHKRGYVRQVLSQVLRDAGIRRRKRGAGRETPQEALALLAYAKERYPQMAAKFLLAAYRAAKAQEKVELTNQSAALVG